MQLRAGLMAGAVPRAGMSLECSGRWATIGCVHARVHTHSHTLGATVLMSMGLNSYPAA